MEKVGILKDSNIETPVVCNIFDVNGEVAGVASVQAIEKYLTPDWILHFKSTIHHAPLLLVDANLNLPSLQASRKIAADSECPVWFEPVSVTKSKRITSIVKHVTYTSPNEDELIAMANALLGADVFHPLKANHNLSPLSLFHMLKPAILVLLEKGIKVVVLTLGSKGLILYSKGGPNHIRSRLKKTTQSGSGEKLYETIMQKCPPNQCFVVSDPDKSSHLFAVHFPSLPASVEAYWCG
ncbi:hypothetical protein K1719_035377 [Acacia pycnantha]|nr:hypothetical protein K1719_035377 [Acacia pycnantha]